MGRWVPGSECLEQPQRAACETFAQGRQPPTGRVRGAGSHLVAAGRDRRWVGTLAALVAGLIAVGLWRLGAGPSAHGDAGVSRALLSLRVHASLIAALAGSSLAVAGVLMQGIFRNPLADPGVIGVGAGANLGGMLAMAGYEMGLAGRRWPVPYEMLLPLGCILGALGALGVLLVLLSFRRDTLTVLLAGVIMSMLLASVGAVLKAVIAERWELLRAVMTFTMGDIAGKGWRHILLATPLVLAGLLAAWMLARPLDILLSGEDEARSLGVDVAATRFWAVLWTSLLVAAAVAIGGNVAFVGLMVPHLLRSLVGTCHRRLIPLAALGGAVFVLGCDCVSVTVGTRSFIPLGVITGLVGAPLFFVLLARSRRLGAWS
jgi:iron complex transport system permease protein